MKIVKEYWYGILIIAFLLFAAGVFIGFGEGSYIAIHDNLDLFIPQYRMMREGGLFWARNGEVPFLGGVSRDLLPAEFSLYTMLYMILPDFAAYITGYFLKILIAVVSCHLLAREWLREDFRNYRPIVGLAGFAYGILNLFPNFGIPFATIPLAVFVLLRVYRAESGKSAGKWYLALLFYPLLSYFSYFGLFILAYLAAGIIWLRIRDKKICWKLILALVVLAAGYIGCEYRLFGQMLFGGEETIRATLVAGSFTFSEIVREIAVVWSQGMFHAESVHTWLVLPVCASYFLILNLGYIRKKNGKAIFHDVYNLLALLIAFNSLIYGLYYWEGFRDVLEQLVPPLTGWQFNRTVFFSPFLWYASFFLVLKRMYDSRQKWWKLYANVAALAAIAVILLSGTRYNDLYHTGYQKAWELVKGKTSDQLSYEAFYSTELFTAAREAIGYQGEWSAAYGFYPAVLQYNGIASLDGYLGFYPQEYKEAFREVIAPALDRIPASRVYYDEWGARVNLYSGNHPSVISPVRSLPVTEDELYMDKDAYMALGGKYIFSRLVLKNPESAGVRLIAKLSGADYSSPYDLYVYETRS